MATRLHQVLTFPAVAAGGQLAVPHQINWNGRSVIPDLIFPSVDNGEFTVISVTETTMTIRNDEAAVASFSFWLLSLHSIERAFGQVPPPEFLTPNPFVTGGAGGGGGGALGLLQVFRYTVTGLEPDPSDFMVTLPAARLTDVYRVVGSFAGAAVILALDFPDLAVGDRTTTQFRVITSANTQAGDQIDFFVSDPIF